MVNEKINNISNCPVMEQTGDGTLVGRCWFFLPDGKTCPRHGDLKQLDIINKQVNV